MLEAADIQVLEAAYIRRMQFEAKVNAVAIVETLAQVLMGSKTGRTGMTDGGRIFNRVSTEDGLARMGVFL